MISSIVAFAAQAIAGASLLVGSALGSIYIPPKDNLPKYPEQVVIAEMDYAGFPSPRGTYWAYAGEDTTLEFGYIYVPYKAQLGWEDSTYHITSIGFKAYQSSDGAVASFEANLRDIPYAFGEYSPTSNVYNIYQYGGFVYSGSAWCGSNWELSPISSTYLTSSGFLRYQTPITTTSSGPYKFHIDLNNAELLGFFEKMIEEPVIRTVWSQNDYGQGYYQGEHDGEATGYAKGYAEGYQVAADELSMSTLTISSLFGAVVGIPVSVLNGLTPLVIWNIPIISIIITFLFAGLLLWIVRRFIGG